MIGILSNYKNGRTIETSEKPFRKEKSDVWKFKGRNGKKQDDRNGHGERAPYNPSIFL